MKGKRVIVWFRQDLRLADNEALAHAINSGEEVYPIYIFDERLFMGKTRFGFSKVGKYRTKFIIEAVQDLQANLRALGSDLIVRIGKPEEIIFSLARQLKSSWVFCNRERTKEEVEVQDALERNLWSVGQEIIYSRGKMLYYTQDLPFPITHCPEVFSNFRKEVERFVPVREPLSKPNSFNSVSVDIPKGNIPNLADFGFEDFEAPTQAFSPKGGETNALNRLKYYLWDTNLIKKYKETRNQLLGTDYSSKLSPWLAQGCISPKTIYYELKKYEAENGSNDSTYWLFFELLWRDFFRLMGKKHENQIFLQGGIKGEIDAAWKNDKNLLQLWIEGRTGVPFIDANMRELAMSGFMSNRGRQNVASFLVKDLHVNWQLGASYFESILIDYDVTSNWCNWNYVAGVGNDPRENRYFNILSQARRYDPKGEYVKTWLPELESVPDHKIHRPDQLSSEEQESSHVKIGADYPRSMISMSRWD